MAGGVSGGASGRLLGVDRLFIGYLAATGLLALWADRPIGLMLVLVHGLAIFTLVVWSRRPLPRRRAARLVRLLYPIMLIPPLYAELPLLNQILGEGFHDPLVQGWDAVLFGGQPSVGAVTALPFFWLSEFLHLGYISYYLLVPTALFGVWRTRGEAALHRATFATTLAFFLCYAVFTVFPVTGPRYLSPAFAGVLAEGAVHDAVHTILEGYSSKGTAFPSSHVAGAGAAVLAAGLHDRRWFWLLLLPWLALTLGTVYGRFHYGVDAVAGAVVALAAGWMGPGLADALGPWPADQRAVGSSNSRIDAGSTGTPPT